MIFHHLLGSWRNYNCNEKINKNEYCDDLHNFVDKFNQIVKFLNFYSAPREMEDVVRSLIQFVNSTNAELNKKYGIFVHLFAFQIPRFTIEETDSTQPFLQSPIQVTILENQTPETLPEYIKKIQKLQKSESDHIRFAIMFYSHKSIKVSPEINHNRGKKVQKTIIQQQPQILRESKLNKDIYQLKEDLFQKLDEQCTNIEYSIPQNLAKSAKRKKQDEKDRISAGAKNYFRKKRDCI